MTPVAIPQADDITKTAEELKKLKDDGEKKEALEEDDDDDEEDDENAQAGGIGGEYLGWSDELPLIRFLCRGEKEEKEEEEYGQPNAFVDVLSDFAFIRQEEEGCSVLSSASSRVQDLQERCLSRRRRARVQERVSHP
jgi:hypothetical protein